MSTDRSLADASRIGNTPTSWIDSEELQRRALPHNIEAEQALLGGLLLDNDAFHRIDCDLQPGHFYDPLHGRIYTVIRAFIGKGQAATVATVAPYFANEPMLSDTLTVPRYLGRLMAAAVGARYISDYAKTVLDLATRRALIRVGEEMVSAAFAAEVDVEPGDLVAEAEGHLLAVSQARGGSDTAEFATVLDDLLVDINDAYIAGGRSRGLSTGFSDLDGKLGGLRDGNLYVLAGRPSMGKTALAVQIGWNVARKFVGSKGEVGAPVAVFSLEMPKDQLALRLLSMSSEVNAMSLDTGRLTAAEVARAMRTGTLIRETPLIIDDTGGATLGRIAAKARRMKARHGIGLIIIDYLQLMAGNGRRDANRTAEITEITTGLKSLAKELGVPILALSQLSRAVEQRSDKRPQLSDLRESGSIEQDADAVMFVFREDYYLERERPSSVGEDATDKLYEWEAKLNAARGKAEVILGKQRHGPVGAIEMAWDAELTKFSSLEVRHG